MKDTQRWTAQKIASRLPIIEPLVYRKKALLDPFDYRPLMAYNEFFELDPAAENKNLWTNIPFDSYWGEWYTNFALKSSFTIPEDWERTSLTGLYLPFGESGDFCHPEALVFIDGDQQASCDRYHQEILLPQSLNDSKKHSLSLVGWTGIGEVAQGLRSKLYMRPCYVVQVDQPTRNLIAYARVALGIFESLGENEPSRWRLVNALDEAFNCLDLAEPIGGERFYQSIPNATQTLLSGIREAGTALDIDVYAAGHAHLDVAWLWPLEQTRRKARHTFQTVLDLMDQFSDFVFTQSQPQLYDFVRKDAPQLFKKIQDRVQEGRWEPIGGMWVEADCNLTGGESLARQFLLGRRFFRDNFGEGADSKVLWLPDVFGYAWNLPQLIKQAGLEYFFTIKIGWNQYNRLPYDSFWWQGLDGTKVLTHFSPTPEAGSIDSGHGTSTYNAAVLPIQAIGSWTNFQQKDLAKSGKSLPVLMAYGYGDGGGGPTREMLENLAIMKDFPGTPRLIPSKVGDFFSKLEHEQGEYLPTWNGELYLELHRGTYTTQGRNKRANRKSEFLLHDSEFLAALAAQIAPDYQYPLKSFNNCWEIVCLNQFHDIIPGSSVTQVYIESLQQYQQVEKTLKGIQVNAVKAVIGSLDIQWEAGVFPLIIINPTSFSRNDLVFWGGKLPEGMVMACQGRQVFTQADIDGTWIWLEDCLAYSINQINLVESTSLTTWEENADTHLTANEQMLENDLLLVELNQDGDITRIFDKAAQREVLPPGKLANQFQAFEDRPLNWDAWDVDIFYDDRMWLSQPAESIEVVAAGPLYAAIKIKRRILHSEYTQVISLGFNSARLDFETHINWQEKHVFLKAAFPVDILSPTAAYEIQWGNVERPTHRNTSWDWARFETCAQKWVDLSEGGYGVSLLNDCKYGHDIFENVMRISLLRSPTLPDPMADEGEHHFIYSLYPHSGRWDERTVSAAYAINDPLLIVDSADFSAHSLAKTSAKKSANIGPFIQVDAGNIIIETIKQAENGEGIIVRLYEFKRCRNLATLTAEFAISKAWKTNILEENQEQLKVDVNKLLIEVHPYEIVTLRLIPLAG